MKSYILVFTLLISSALTIPTYLSHINVSDTSSGDADLGTFAMKFTMEKSKVKYGQIFGVPVFQIELKGCSVKIAEDQYPDWYAAFVNVPGKCGARAIAKALESVGADFIFLNHEPTDIVKPKQLPHEIEVPVYEQDSKINANFINEIKTKGDGTILTITMPYPKSVNGTAVMEFFYTPTNYRSFKYIEELEVVLQKLNKHVHFEPFVVLYSNVRNPQSRNCRDGGKYCAPDPDNDGKFTGRDVVDEMLRQKCIYKLDASQWIMYMKNYQDRCMEDITSSCSYSILNKFLEVRKDKVKKCEAESEITISGSSNSQADNTILENEMKKLKESHEMTFPALYVNGQRFEGHVKANEILIKACDTFDFKPQACTEVQIEYEGKHMSMVWSIQIYLYVLMLGLIVIAFACIGIAKRVAKREVNFQVKDSVARYYQMKESETLN